MERRVGNHQHQCAEIVQQCGASPQRVQGEERFSTIGVPLAALSHFLFEALVDHDRFHRLAKVECNSWNSFNVQASMDKSLTLYRTNPTHTHGLSHSRTHALSHSRHMLHSFTTFVISQLPIHLPIHHPCPQCYPNPIMLGNLPPPRLSLTLKVIPTEIKHAFNNISTTTWH
jgi:hypothetical protein